MPRGAVADRHQQKGRQVFVAVSLAFETGGALDNEGKSVRIVECSSVGPWPWREGTDFCRVLVVECCAADFFVECSSSPLRPLFVPCASLLFLPKNGAHVQKKSALRGRFISGPRPAGARPLRKTGD